MRQLWKNFLLPIATCMLQAPSTHAEETVVIGVTSGSPPYVYSIEEGRGLDMDIMRAITDEMGRDVRFVPVPFARRSIILKDGKVDAVTFWTKPTDVTCYAAQPYRYWRNALFDVRRKGATAEASGTDERIGIFRGSDHLAPALAEAGIDHTNLQKISTIRAAVRMLLYERLDGYIGDYPTVIYNFREEDPEGKFEAHIRTFFPPAPQRLCFTDKATQEAFDLALERIIRNAPETLSAITKAHGLTEQITPPLDK
ncbi:MAG: transporter substrate-binding domain-containing protein [Alphaproteobacteria bacterium]|nr:transporter substrate-binding domain-containing protein [Alphaproteobacteria bacterium]